MQEKHLFEYAVLRLVPRVEREEFINTGVILYCPGRGFLQAMTELNADKIKMLSPDQDLEEFARYLQTFELICNGGRGSGPIGQLAVSSRFRWLTATRSTVFQSSKVHAGFCTDPVDTLRRLYRELVL